MGSVMVIVSIGLIIGWIIWRRQQRWQAYAPPVIAEGIPRETLALKAFMRGNSCMAAGEFADAVAAFYQAREMDPKRAYVADRLAEAERQLAASAALAASSPD